MNWALSTPNWNWKKQWKNAALSRVLRFRVFNCSTQILIAMAIFEVTHLNGVEADTPYDAVFTPESVMSPAQENADGDVVITVRRGTPDGGSDEYTVSDTLSVVNEGLSIGTSGAQAASARVQSLSAASTAAEYPSAEAVYDIQVEVLAQARILANTSGLLLDGDAAATYPFNSGHQLVATGGTQVRPIGLVHILAANFQTVGDLAPKLQVQGVLSVNDAAPVGNFTIGLYPVTRPSSSGGSTGLIYTLGTVVAGSTAAFTAPAADSMAVANSTAFALPSDGFYCLGVVSSATVATSSAVHMVAVLKATNAA